MFHNVLQEGRFAIESLTCGEGPPFSILRLARMANWHKSRGSTVRIVEHYILDNVHAARIEGGELRDAECPESKIAGCERKQLEGDHAQGDDRLGALHVDLC